MTKSHFTIKCSKRRSVLFTRFNVKHPQNNARPFAIKRIRVSSKPYFVVKKRIVLSSISEREFINLKDTAKNDVKEQCYE